MAKYMNPTKVITGPNTTFSYLNCWDPKAIQGGTPKFSVSLIIPKPAVKTIEQIKADWAAFRGPAQELDLPSAPKQFLHYFEEENRPQTRLDRMLEHGMAVSLGRLREDSQYDYKFVGLSHNTLRGAAGGAVLLAELLCKKGYIEAR